MWLKSIPLGNRGPDLIPVPALQATGVGIHLRIVEPGERFLDRPQVRRGILLIKEPEQLRPIKMLHELIQVPEILFAPAVGDRIQLHRGDVLHRQQTDTVRVPHLRNHRIPVRQAVDPYALDHPRNLDAESGME